MKLFSVLLTCFILTISLNAQKKPINVDALLKKMTLDEKLGQMTQIDYEAVKNHADDLIKYSIGSVLWGGNSEIVNITAQGWADCYDSLQRLSEKTRLKIPMIFGIDAVHGHNNVDGAVIFPHNIALGATHNPAIVEKVAIATAQEVKGTGIHWAFSPCVAVVRNERWGRTYESFGEDPELVRMLGAAHVKGLQGANLSDKNSVLACVKHYMGDGGTTSGTDQGNTVADEATMRKLFLPAYTDAINAGALSIMASYNSWNGIKMHGNKYLLTDVLKGELKFQGFVVGDWNGIDQLSPNYKYAVEQSINAGLDMAMITTPRGSFNSYDKFISTLKELVNEKAVSMKRIDDAVSRILKAKIAMGLFDQKYSDKALLAEVGSPAHREVGRDAVRQSLVLLKNENNLLPLSKTAKKVVVAGKGADDIGIQCGGWTIDWQGKSGKVISGGTTILSAIKNTVSKETKVTFSLDGSGADSGDVAIVVVGELPYAEMFGDREDLSLSMDDQTLVQNLSAKGVQVVVVILSGRPMIINGTLEKSNAVVAAWLPGTEGQGVADVLFGNYAPTGKLPHSWPKNMKQIPINVGDKEYDPLFPFGFGLTYPSARALK
ncbi:MAG: glycoside hydrolase family 3 N-terminal domain-containing protein [Bacteroidota bacterium]|nr:glycoside hydrolase family 3 N-terminal domain-containing protein [Bacteroidota bacterium]